MKTQKRFTMRLFSVFLCIAMLLTSLPLAALMVFASETDEYQGGAGEKISDEDTSTKYSDLLGDNASTEYAGGIWTDKSVYTDDATFEMFGGKKVTIQLNGDKNGEDFLIAYSVLATAESISGQTQAPVDVVFIIDISGSMSNSKSNMDNGKSRIYNTVQATNNAIDELMTLNPHTRVAVVAFSNTAQVLLPFDRYTKTTTVQRKWVSTGWNQGYWQETVVEVPYFTLNRDTGSDNYATLYTNAINSSNRTIEIETDVEGGTNIQLGLYEGMKVLTDVAKQDTVVDIDGQIVQRVPSVILLSDGSPTYSSDSRSWWAPADNNGDGPGSAPYAGNGMKAILVGSYMKDAIDRNYGVANTAFATRVYTIGMGISGLDSDEKNLAYMTLDPGTYWNDANADNRMKTAIKGYWSSYTADNNTGTLNINVGQQTNRGYQDKNYYLTHPTTGFDVDPVNGYDYVDAYYDADNALTVTDVFREIVDNIAISSPQVPTELKGSNPMADGYITYTDPIGEYMEIKDMKAVIYADTLFTVKSVTTDGNTTIYTFAGKVHSPVYGDQDIQHILITVDQTDGRQSLVIKIPASVIPLRVNEIMLNADGSVKTHTNNGAMPARVVYSVGLQSEITKVAGDGTVYIDRSKISADYLKANTNRDGTIRFYSNEYTNTNVVNNKTAGDVTVEFEPSHTNGFYYILEDMPIYKDAECKEQVSATDGLDDYAVYYFRDEFYRGNKIEVTAIECTGAQLKMTEIKTGADGNLYRAAGSVRLNRILRFDGTKIQNSTQTAEDFYVPQFIYAEGSTNAYDGICKVYLGNNGVLTMIAGGDLQITKTVLADEGLTAPAKTFEFTIDLDGDEVNDGMYDYAIVNAADVTVGRGTVSGNSPKINLQNGETATIYGLPPGTTYQVTETVVAGFTAASDGATGTITAGQTSVVRFTNTYSVAPVEWPANSDLQGTKELAGREWDANDSFSFFLLPYNNAPLPDGYDETHGVTVNRPDTEGGQTATFVFGTILFTAPGVYRYTIGEKEPDNNAYLPGMTYSGALYRVVVTVVDNGDGTLSVASADVQRLYNDDADPLFTYQDGQIVMNCGEEGQDTIRFTNTYSAEAVSFVPDAIKEYTDHSGENPLVSGMFDFELKAIGIVENGAVVENSASSVPMPDGSVNGAILTTNEGTNITFPSITFTQSDIPHGASTVTFRYQMREVILGTPTVGMTYDDTVYTIDVVVSIDPGKSALQISAVYPKARSVITFQNEYTPIFVSVDIDGNKTLIGRDMRSDERFEFRLGYDTATVNAIRDGMIAVPSDIATVTGAKNGVASAFAFENIEFKKAGTYGFTVSEISGDASSVTYDTQVVTVTVVIADVSNDGRLDVVSVTYSNGKTAAEFTNTYQAENAEIIINATKTLTGRDLNGGEFRFVIKDKDGNLLAMTTNAEDGTIVFEKIIITKAGTYTYIVSEESGTLAHITYDPTEYIVE
ncbi:MAG: Spy0128 family protein, partial [Eubacteriales bacterium]